MTFQQKTFTAVLCAYFWCLATYAQINQNSQIYTLPKDSLRKYWIEMLDSRNFVWTGFGVGIINPNFTRFADEVNFAPKRKNDVYTIRLRLSFSNRNAGLPTAYTREVSTMYGKIYKGYKFMATASAGLSYVWGHKWLDEIGIVTTPPARGLRQRTTTAPLYNSENFWTVGIPLRAQAFFITGKEMAFGITLGTTLNIKQIWGDAMFTCLIGIN